MSEALELEDICQKYRICRDVKRAELVENSKVSLDVKNTDLEEMSKVLNKWTW